MIRHHEVQDSLSAEAAPLYLASSPTAMPHAAPHPAYVPVQNSSHGESGAMLGHPFAFYAAPLSSVVLILAAVIALRAFIRVVAPRLRFITSMKDIEQLYHIKSGSHGYKISRR